MESDTSFNFEEIRDRGRFDFNRGRGVKDEDELDLDIANHWFYMKAPREKNYKEVWNPFSKENSSLLERAYLEGTDKVPVMGSHFDANLD